MTTLITAAKEILSHRNTVLYTVEEKRTIYSIVLLHDITYIILLSYRLALN